MSRFLILMENWDQALSATDTALQSNGSAMRENERYLESYEAKINKVKNAWTESALALQEDILGDVLLTFTEYGTGFLNTLTKIIDTVGVLPTLFAVAGAAVGGFTNKLQVLNLKNHMENLGFNFKGGLGSFTKDLGVAITMLSVDMGQAIRKTVTHLRAMPIQMTAFRIQTVLAQTALNVLSAAGRVLVTVLGGLARIALPTLAFWGLGQAISWVTGKIREKKEAAAELERNMATTRDTINTNKDGITELVDEYEKLEKLGVDRDNEQEQEYLELQRQIGEALPDLVIGENEKGEVILANTKIMKDYIEVMDEQIQRENERNVVGADGRMEDIRANIESLHQDIEEDQRKLDVLHSKINEAIEDQNLRAEIKLRKLASELSDSVGEKVLEIGEEMASLEEQVNNLFSTLDFTLDGESQSWIMGIAEESELGIDAIESLATRVFELQEQLSGDINLDIIDMEQFEIIEGIAEAVEEGGRTWLEYSMILTDAGFSSQETGQILGYLKHDTEELARAAEDAGYAFNDSIPVFERNGDVSGWLADVQNMLADDLDGASDALFDQTAELDHNSDAKMDNFSATDLLFGITGEQITQMDNAIATLALLSEMEYLSAEQKLQAEEATAILSNAYPHLNGNIMENIDWIINEVNMLSDLSKMSAESATTMMRNQDATTRSTVNAINSRIAGYQKEADALAGLSGAIGALAAVDKSSGGHLGLAGGLSKAVEQASAASNIRFGLAEANSALLSAYHGAGVAQDLIKPRASRGGSGSKSKSPSRGGSGSGSGRKATPKSSRGSSAKDREKEREVEIKQLDRFAIKITELNEALAESEYRASLLEPTSAAYRKELEKQSVTLSDLAAHTKGQSLALEQRNKQINTEINRLTRVKSLTNDQKESLNALRTELEKNVSEIHSLNNAWRGYQQQLQSLQSDLHGNIADIIAEEQKKREKILRDEMDRVDEHYNQLIEKKQEELDMLDEQIEKEDRLKKMREMEENILRVKSDKRFSYITKEGEEILTYNREQVAELEKERDEMIAQFERDDLRKAMQDEIDELREHQRKARDAHNDRLEDFTAYWEDLVSRAREGTLSFNELQRAWTDTSIAELQSHVGGTGQELDNLGGMYQTLGRIEKDMNTRAQQINTSVSNANKNTNTNINRMGSSTSTGMKNINDDVKRAGRAYNDSISSIGNSAKKGLNRMVADAQNTTKKLAKELDKANKQATKVLGALAGAQKNASKISGVASTAINTAKRVGGAAAATGAIGAATGRGSSGSLGALGGLTPRYHTGGIVGDERGNRLTQLANRVMNLKPNEQAVIALKDELMVPKENIPNLFGNLRGLMAATVQPKLTSNQDNSRPIHIGTVELTADSPLEMFEQLKNISNKY